ncbi:MAG: imidazoleglycerol-phosphate dehydratase HisB [ANME-2 cluster archaeon]|jgi:imidazoleglycerol-phosphate dehydratase|nr:MAG: imidazoleglycerol-phosphate dehydratase HisB [ANME-2 cluster archaeon]
MRKATIHRKTNETEIDLTFVIEGTGRSEIGTGVAFLDHVLDSFARHGLFDLTIRAAGDTELGDHHLVEDIGIVLGQAIAQALGDHAGIARFADVRVPMDEASASVILDLSGRSYLVFDVGFSSDVVGDLTTQMVPHFFHSLITSAGINAHISASGGNDHHVIEAIFKAFGIALRRSATVERSDVPSTKGVLTD